MDPIKELSLPSRAKRKECLELLAQDRSFNPELVNIAIEVDNVPPDIFQYRDKERHLENLLRVSKASQCEKSHTAIINFLLGSLYINFEKFWSPTLRVLIDLLKHSKFQKKLLNDVLDHLRVTNNYIYEQDGVDAIILDPKDRPDHILHRNFVFQILNSFPSYIEANNRVFMDELFRFLQKDMLVSPFIEKYSCDNLVGGKGKKKDDEKVPLRKKTRETFITATKVIQSFNNIHLIHRNVEFKGFLLDLLCCRDGLVQKAAFNCILVYEDEKLRPYIEKIMKILNEKMIRTELTSFSIDADETDQVHDDHRSVLMPILMRVLFGKMIGKIDKKTTGRDKSDLRKSLIMRYIAGCTFQELQYFFGLLFDPIYKFINIPYRELDSELSKKMDLQNYVPLNKLQAMLGSISAFMKSVGHIKEESLAHILKLINLIIFHVVKPLETEELAKEIKPKNIELLRALKRTCINTYTEFFEMFEYYDYEQQEINFMFEFVIWCSTDGFIDKNYAAPTPMLRLIHTFASNKKYHPLLVKRNKRDRDEYVLRHIVELYSSPKTSRQVIKFLGTLFASILESDTAVDTVDDASRSTSEALLLMDEDSVVPIYDKSQYKIDKVLPFNEEILISFIPVIFERLRKSCREFVNKKDTEIRIENDELTIISKLSQYLKSSEQSLIGVQLLLSTLNFQKSGVLILSTLKTIQILTKQVRDISDPTIIPLISDFLSYQRNIDQRKELCAILESLADINDDLKVVCRAISLMNATSEELMDSPDLVKWNEGFRMSFEYLDTLTISDINETKKVRESLILLIHQTKFIVTNIDKYEFSIRENCSIFYEKFALRMKLIDMDNNRAFAQEILNNILLDNFIKKGLRETNETVKNTIIDILRSLALHCHQKDRTLAEFYNFCNENQDLDFWLNIKHIQLHNRSRALARIIASDEINTISSKTLSSYFMPLASGFLFSKAYKSVSSLSDNAIKLIGIICKHLNWVTYESTLSYYLDLLTKANATYQRTNIKLVTEILRNFNFDLTSCQEAMENHEENSKLEQRMKKRLGSSESSKVLATDAPKGKRLNPSTARMIYYGVTKKLIPKLNNCLHEMTRVEFEHDKNMANYMPEKEEIKRVPMAYAIVQLLNLLPGRYVLFRDHLPTLFLKLSSFLKSKNEDVRKATRATLIKIMTFVGPAYMQDFLRVLKQNLDKGFQIHVLNYTIHSVLEKCPLTYGSLDNSAHELVNSCFQEVFGKIAEDKEIAQILAKTYEAKKTKSYDTLFILSSYISSDKLDYLMNSLGELLKTSNDSKKVNKLSLCIQKVFAGLAQNDDFPVEESLKFIQKTVEEYIPNLKAKEKIDEVEKSNSNLQDSKSKISLREDRFLIAKDFSRDRIKSRINEKGNSHMVVENCLKLLLHILEKNKFIIEQREDGKIRLDEFVPLLTTCLKSSSPKCVTRSLKCLHFIAQSKSSSPLFELKCNSIVKKIFILLSLYNGVGMAQGDNFDMIAMCFKTLSLLLLRCKQFKLSDNQIRVLLTYIEQDLHDTSRQTTAFGTLHVIVRRKFESPELAHIMSKVQNLLVTSDDDTVRATSIKIWRAYLLDYKQESDMLRRHLDEFFKQLNYEFVDGRESVIKMLNIIVTSFPEKLLRDYADSMFFSLAQRIVREEAKEVRISVGKLIGALIQRLPEKQSFFLDKFIMRWVTNSDYELKLLAFKLTSVFIESCPSLFKSKSGKAHVPKLLDLIPDSLNYKKVLEETDNEDNKMDVEQDENIDNEDESVASKSVNNDFRLPSFQDKLYYHTLRLFERLIDKDIIKPVEDRHITHLKVIWHNISKEKLTYWYLPVVITSCQLYIKFIKNTDLGEALKIKDPPSDNYLQWNAKRIVQTLCDRFVSLLDRAEESKELMVYISECLIRLSSFVAQSRATVEFEQDYLNSFHELGFYEHMLNLKDLPNDGFSHDHLPFDFQECKKRVNLTWLGLKIVMQARKEAAMYRTTKFYRRNFVLSWAAAISQELGVHRLKSYVFLFMMTPIRELTDRGKSRIDENSPNHRTLKMSDDLLKFMKTLLGVETFNQIYSRIQLHYTKKRVERKKLAALRKVQHPEKKSTKRRAPKTKKMSKVKRLKK